MTTDEQRALELADLLHTAYEAELEHEHGIEHMAAFLLPLIRDQGRYQKVRECPSLTMEQYEAVFLPPEEIDAAVDQARGET